MLTEIETNILAPKKINHAVLIRHTTPGYCLVSLVWEFETSQLQGDHIEEGDNCDYKSVDVMVNAADNAIEVRFGYPSINLDENKWREKNFLEESLAKAFLSPEIHIRRAGNNSSGNNSYAEAGYGGGLS